MIYDTLKKPKFILQGIATFLPDWVPLPHHQKQFKGKGLREYEGAKDTALVHYTTWMRIFVGAHENGQKIKLGDVAEIGPGDCVGSGIAALLCGAESYTGFDITPTAHNYHNEEILEEMIKLFLERHPIPDESLFGKHRPYLRSYNFPKYILTDEILRKNFAPERIARIRESVKNINDLITYEVPWYETKKRVDLVFSAAVMEHVDDVVRTYKTIAKTLRPGGLLLEVIDYNSHHTASQWNGHLDYSPIIWKIVRGKCLFFINRWTHSMHRTEMQKYFSILVDISYKKENVLYLSKYSEEDRVASTSFFIVKKE